jgi:hypothetical protein
MKGTEEKERSEAQDRDERNDEGQLIEIVLRIRRFETVGHDVILLTRYGCE